MEECKINVPKFANEAVFLRGKDIIDTRTYYPNIPGLWMWEFNLFDDKIINSKKEQPDCPIMILELQAGWFAQVGAPIYKPKIEVIEGVSKSAFIQGASVINYYMMVGGTTFPFMGARGDIYFLGGLGNITSYDFGSSPIREGGKIDKNKFYWIKGFIRFAKEFADIVLKSDKKSYVKIISGGEDIALLGKSGAVLDTTLEKDSENFAVYEEGNRKGRFLFLRNLENDDKIITLSISKDLLGKEYIFKTTVRTKETKLLPIAFKISDTGIIINYSTSEILLSKKYGEKTVFVMYGKSKTNGEICINKNPRMINILSGNVRISKKESNSLLRYNHSGLNVLKIENVYLLIIGQEMVGRVEELCAGLLFYNMYYIQEINEKQDEIRLKVQIREKDNNMIKIFSMAENKKINAICLDKNKIKFMFDEKINMYTTNFSLKPFVNKPCVQWSSDWKYIADSDEVNDSYDFSNWLRLDNPISLEEAGFIEHGYYWYKTQFNLKSIPGVLLMDYDHNNTDRIFIYVNEILIFKSYNKKLKHINIANVVRSGKNTVTILYANEFHNKSHPHEGDIVKFSGIIKPIKIYGKYADNEKLNISLTSFYVKKGLSGINKGYHTLEYNDDSWNSIPNVKKFVVGRQLGHIIWFRRKFEYNYKKEVFSAPLAIKVKEADQKLTIYINGNAIGRYDSLGPQKKFYIPEPFLNLNKNNVLSIILECPGFYDELQSGYKRGYMHNLVLEPDYIAKKICMKILLK
ncbi:MAG: beta-galactosidase, partial [Actinomycetota bacterium]|nr:beta-galactosidase [Actinomycetota bacterium]